MSKKTTVNLVGMPEDPLGLLYLIWQQSRTNEPVKTAYEYEGRIRHYMRNRDPEWGKLEHDTVMALVRDDVPVTECLYFTFLLENVPVSLREQLVRHRIGCKVGPLQGIDQIPDLGTSTFWSQTSRMVSQGDFYDAERYYTPPSVIGHRPLSRVHEHSMNTEEFYHDTMREMQYRYNELIDAGVPMEDARQVLPSAATQSMTWTLSLKTIIHVLGKRACWIAQYNLWATVIQQMVDQLSEKVHPTMFRQLIQPPCMDKGKYKSCPIVMINMDRIKGNDPYPPCPMYLNHEANRILPSGDTDSDTWYNHQLKVWKSDDPQQTDMMFTMREQFAEAWGINPDTGEPIKE